MLACFQTEILRVGCVVECITAGVVRDLLLLTKFDRVPPGASLADFQCRGYMSVADLCICKTTSLLLFDDSAFSFAVASASRFMCAFAFSVTAPSTHSVDMSVVLMPTNQRRRCTHHSASSMQTHRELIRTTRKFPWSVYHRD